MPGGKAQWYAMRNRLQKAGKWKHSVPAQEEGEPPTKQPRTDSGPESPPENQEGAPGAPESDPEEGTSERARGKYFYFIF